MDLINKESWSEEDILHLIASKAEENINLDFKRAAALEPKKNEPNPKAEITKDVSAFANSDGGVIIYGLSEKDHVADSVDFIDGDKYTKEWLDQLIAGGIKRTIPGLRIFPVRFDNDIKKSVYIVSIPASQEAPHMTSDNRYYRRYDFQSVKMEEYEVRNLFNKISTPNIDFTEFMLKHTNAFNCKASGRFTFDVFVMLQNHGKGIAELYKTVVWVPVNSTITVTMEEERKNLNFRHNNAGVHLAQVGILPIFPNDVVIGVVFTITIQNHNNIYKMLNELTTVYLLVLCGASQKTHSLPVFQRIAERLVELNYISSNHA